MLIGLRELQHDQQTSSDREGAGAHRSLTVAARLERLAYWAWKEVLRRPWLYRLALCASRAGSFARWRATAGCRACRDRAPAGRRPATSRPRQSGLFGSGGRNWMAGRKCSLATRPKRCLLFLGRPSCWACTALWSSAPLPAVPVIRPVLELIDRPGSRPTVTCYATPKAGRSEPGARLMTCKAPGPLPCRVGRALVGVGLGAFHRDARAESLVRIRARPILSFCTIANRSRRVGSAAIRSPSLAEALLPGRGVPVRPSAPVPRYAARVRPARSAIRAAVRRRWRA